MATTGFTTQYASSSGDLSKSSLNHNSVPYTNSTIHSTANRSGTTQYQPSELTTITPYNSYSISETYNKITITYAVKNKSQNKVSVTISNPFPKTRTVEIRPIYDQLTISESGLLYNHQLTIPPESTTTITGTIDRKYIVKINSQLSDDGLFITPTLIQDESIIHIPKTKNGGVFKNKTTGVLVTKNTTSYTTQTQLIEGERITLVDFNTDSRNSPNPNLNRLFTKLQYTSTQFENNYHQSPITGFIIPFDKSDKLVYSRTKGINFGSVFIIREEEINTTKFGFRDVLIHEYIHSQQKPVDNSVPQWVTEGSTSYYTAQINYPEEKLGYQSFFYSSAVNTLGISSWITRLTGSDVLYSNYYRGAVYMNQLNKSIVSNTNGKKSLNIVFKELPADYTYKEFKVKCIKYGGVEAQRIFKQYESGNILYPNITTLINPVFYFLVFQQLSLPITIGNLFFSIYLVSIMTTSSLLIVQSYQRHKNRIQWILMKLRP